MAKSTVQDQSPSSVHLILQGKGGVGKSLTAAFLAQYFESIGIEPKCIDTDPVNQTFTNFLALKAQHLPILDGKKINERKFDELMERLLSEAGVFVIDNGSSSFVPLSNYLLENRAFPMLQQAGKEVFIHCIVVGGQGLADTLTAFDALCDQADTKNIVVWINEYFGAVEHDGKGFTEMKTYVKNKDKVRGIVRLVKRNQDTFSKDIENMTSKKLTFGEAIDGADFSIMAKQRIKTVQKDIFEQLDTVGF